MKYLTLTFLALGTLTFISAGQTDDDAPDLTPLVDLLGQVDDDEVRLDLLKGMRAGLRGRKSLPMPKQWAKTYATLAKSKNEQVREQAKFLALIFGDPQVLATLRKVVTQGDAKTSDRKEALQALVEKQVKGLDLDLHRLLDDKELRPDALRGLAAYDHPDTPKQILARYAKLDADEKLDALGTLASRPAYAMRLLEAMEAKKVDRRDLSAFLARQIHNLGDKALTQKLRDVWGEIRMPAANRKELIEKYKDVYTEKVLGKANVRAGRAVFTKTCAQCHSLYGTGGKIGPDLTGSNRNNLDYVLENVLAPSALIGKDYQLNNVYTRRGRVIPGLIVEKTPSRYVIQTANEKVVLSAKDVEKVVVTPQSMMPDGLFDKLKKEEIRDLIGYLATKEQVPLPPTSQE